MVSTSLFSQKRLALRYRLIISIACMLFLLLMLFQQPLFPAPWFDEGLNFSTAAMLAQSGLYALPDSAGPRMIDPAIQTGPTVIVPIALVYRFFGIGLLQARLVMLIFAVFGLAAYGLMAQKIVGHNAALLAIILLIIGSSQEYTNFVLVARQILGEVPALAYYCFGLFLWLQTIERPSKRIPGFILSGLAWGIAMVTKSQIMLIWPVCLAMLMLVDRFYYRYAGPRSFIIPGIVMVLCVLTWYATQIAILGIDQYQQNAAVLRQGFALHIVGMNPNHWYNAAVVIWQTQWWLWGAPALAWGLWQARVRSAQGFRHAMALALPIMSMAWFVLLSIGWGRYAFYPIILSIIWFAALLTKLWEGTLIPGIGRVRKLVLLALVTVYCFMNCQLLAANVFQTRDSGYQAMQSYLREQLPADALIETWAWEMIDVPQPMHHPSTTTTNLATVYIWSLHSKPPADFYTEFPEDTHYILANAFSSWTGIYDRYIQDETVAKKVVSFGSYTLYMLR